MSTAIAPEHDRVTLAAVPTAFNRADRIIYGVKLAEIGFFGSKGRGQFTQRSFDSILQLAAEHPEGLRVRLTHPNMSEDGVTKTLGRMRNLRQSGNAIIGDLHFLELAFRDPVGGGQPLGQFVFDLAEQDNGLIETSFVLDTLKEPVLNEDGTAMLDEDGDRVAPVWIPTKLYASDVVGDGDAVHTGFLSAHNHSTAAARATEVLDRIFESKSREEIRDRGLSFIDRYLDNRFGEVAPTAIPTGVNPDMSHDPKTEAVTLGKLQTVLDDFGSKLLSKVDERVAPLAESHELSKKNEERAKRAEAITALCTKFGRANDAASFIAKSLSAEEVRQILHEDRLLNNVLPASNAVPGDDGTGKPGKKTGIESLRDALSAEYDEAVEVLSKFGLSKDKYVLAGMIESPEAANDDEVVKLKQKLEKTNPLALGLLSD